MIRKGNITPLRLFRLLLISVVAIAQAHLCQASYELPNGQLCQTCPKLDHLDKLASPESLQAVGLFHGDCHDCCRLQPCEDHGKDASTAPSPLSIQVVAIVSERIEFSFATTFVENSCAIHVESAPSTGPPITTSSRAPPVNTNPLPSAGRRFVNIA